VAYQWQVADGSGGWTNVGSNQNTYAVAEGAETHAIRVQASFTDDTSQTGSAPSTPPTKVIDNSSLSVAVTGTAKEGSTLTATPTIGDSDDASATVAYQWQVADGSGGWTNVGSNQSTYAVAEGDETHAIRVQASFTDDTSQTVSATSTATAAVIDNSSLSVAVSGTVKEGSTLTATPTIGDSDDASATVAYQWQVADGSGGWTNVGSNQNTYAVAEGDETHAIRVQASFTDDTSQTV